MNFNDGARADKMDLGIDGRQWAVLVLTIDEFENSILNENKSHARCGGETKSH
jgi:hypothetical protein